MSAIIIQFPRHRCRSEQFGGQGHDRDRGRRRPFNRVDVLRGEDSEVWVIAGSAGWLHGSWTAAVDDAIEVAAGFGVAVSLDH
jgi:hypothetical protein